MLNSKTQPAVDQDPHRWGRIAILVLVVALLVGFLQTGVSQLFVATMLIIVGGALALWRPDAAIISTFVYLLFLGDIRRLVSREAGIASQDPLLVVAPIVAGILFGRLLFERKIRPDTPLATMVLVLLILMTLEIANPAQGGLMIGLAGAMFYIVPLLWFWIGRSLPTERVTRELVQVVFPIVAGVAAVLGLYQTFFGYLAFEGQWVREQIANGFAAMVINGSVLRAFSFFTSPGEYALFLAIGVVCCVAPLVVGRLRLVSLLIPLLAWAMFLASVRGAIVLSLLAVFSMVSLMGRDSQQMVARAFLAVIVGGGLVYFGLHRIEDMGSVNTRLEVLTDHTVNGILNPGESSAGGHLQIAMWGIEKGLKNPLGEGLGATTMAAGRFGAPGTGNSGNGYENDVANMFASLGVLGGLLYTAVILYTLFVAFAVWRDRRTFTALVAFGILVSQLGYWTIGGHYALVAICWFLIGGVDRARRNVAEVSRPVPTVARHAHPAYQP